MRRFYIDPETIDASQFDTEETGSQKAGAAEPNGGIVPLSSGDANHIRNVLRLKPGDPVILFDGTGVEYDARISAIATDGAVLAAICGKILPDTESPVDIIIAQGFLKEKKMDTLIRQLTELGIRRWIPFLAERSVTRPDTKRLKARKQRWEKIAAESLKQCRRSRIPEVGETLTYEEMIASSADADLKIVFWERSSETTPASFSTADARHAKTVFAVLGPEGGLSRDEIDAALAAGFSTAALGPRILRAETATVAACTLLQYFLGDLGKNP